MKRSLVLLILTSAIVGLPCMAQVPAAEPPPEDGPELVLVLSGGGARGAAHIGVLRVLEEMHIAPDMVVGTSMGSIVGGLYAAGWSPDEIEELLVSIDWNQVFTARVPRSSLSFRRKQDDRPFLIKAKLHFDEDGLALPPGLVSSQSLEVLLQTLEAQTLPGQDFDAFPIPFRAVATDLENGEPVVIDSGGLARAMRTSMSIPGLFAPVIREGKTLVDGGAVANLPVGIAKSLGAKTIIAVDISSPLQSPNMKFKNFFDVYKRLNALLTVGNRVEDVGRLRSGDILIRPDLKDISFLAFDRATETVALGEEAAHAAQEQLQHLAAPPDRWEAFIQQHRSRPTDTIRVDRVRMEEAGCIKPSVALHALGIEPPTEINPDDLRIAILRLYHLGHSGLISFRIDEIDGLNELVIDAPSPDYGRHTLQLGLGIFDDFEGAGEYTGTVRYQVLPANRLEGEWLNIFQLGSTSVFFSEFYQPMGASLRWFVVPSVEIRRERLDLWLDDEPFATYKFGREEARLGGGRILGNHGEIRLSAFFSDNSLRRDVGIPALPNAQEYRGGFEFTYSHDTEDSVAFPTTGTKMRFGLVETMDAMGSDSENRQFQMVASTALSVGPYTFRPHLEYGENQHPTEIFADLFFLGGPGRLSGLGNNELYGDTLAFARIQAYRRIKGIDMAGIRIRMYAGLSLEAGNVFELNQSVDIDEFLYGGTVYLGAETPIGPLYLGYGYSQGGRDRWYLAIGDHF
ncbi:MAG: patatin-like phospholipase family protein [Acidobacteriota bacterium]